MLNAQSVTLITAYLSDRYKKRGIPAAILSLLAVIGYAIYLSKLFVVFYRSGVLT